jgi:hypothetical protein
MNTRIALVVDPSSGVFKVVASDEWGNRRTAGEGYELESVLRQSASVLGHPLVVPLSGPETFV